jgi:high-affinity iron transporter
MIGTFVLYLREGLEASLIVSILFAALRQLGLMHQARAVWIGVVLALLGSVLGGAIFFLTIHYYDGSIYDTIFESAAFLIAVVVLTLMTFWMQKHSRTLKSDLVAKASSASSGFALGLLAFTTVGREGIETALFTLAFALNSSSPWLLVLGAILGILAAIALSFMIYRLGYKLDYRLFFRVMGILLIFFAAGFLANVAQTLQEAGWLPIGTATLWNTSAILNEESNIGALLHNLLGYSQAPTVLQGILYIAYLLIVGGYFFWMTRKPKKKNRSEVHPESQMIAQKV